MVKPRFIKGMKTNLERYFVVGLAYAVLSGCMNIVLVCYISSTHTQTGTGIDHDTNDNNIKLSPLRVSDLPKEGPTVILKKSNPNTNSNTNTNSDFYIEVYRRNDIVSEFLQANYGGGSWEEEHITTLSNLYLQYSQSNNIPLNQLTFIDIGANIGWYSFNMAALGVNVIAFEPLSENIALFQHSLTLKSNQHLASRITLYKHGLGNTNTDTDTDTDTNNSCFIYSDNANKGDGHVDCTKVKQEDVQLPGENYQIRGKVTIKRLDDVLLLHDHDHDQNNNHNLDHIVAVKMDAEGYGGQILQGGTKLLLQSNVNVILTEFVPQHMEEKGSDPISFMTQFYNAGYTAKSNTFWSYGRGGGNGGENMYMKQEEMMDMSNFGNDMVILHSASYKNKTLTEFKEDEEQDLDHYNYYNGYNNGYNVSSTDDVYEWKNNINNIDNVYYTNNNNTNNITSSNPTIIKQNQNKQFAIEIYPPSTQDIVSQAIHTSYINWEADLVDTLNKLYLDYSTKHQIPLSNLTFIDIGANLGWLSLNMAALGVNVIAFEPFQSNIKVFQSTLSKKINIQNGISQKIQLYTFGLGRNENEICLLYSDDNNVGDGHVQCGKENELELDLPMHYTFRERVELKRLDDVMIDIVNKNNNINIDHTDTNTNTDHMDTNTDHTARHMHIVAVKMDVEGFEGHVLEGGTNVLLSGGIDAIFTEFEPSWLIEKGGQGDPKQFMQQFADAGYRIKKKDGDWGYMKKKDMINMTNFGTGIGLGDVTFHSPSLVQEFIGGQ